MVGSVRVAASSGPSVSSRPLGEPLRRLAISWDSPARGPGAGCLLTEAVACPANRAGQAMAFGFTLTVLLQHSQGQLEEDCREGRPIRCSFTP